MYSITSVITTWQAMRRRQFSEKSKMRLLGKSQNRTSAAMRQMALFTESFHDNLAKDSILRHYRCLRKSLWIFVTLFSLPQLAPRQVTGKLECFYYTAFFYLDRLPASYRQVKKGIYFQFLLLRIPVRQVTGKLIQPHMGKYFIYLGAVLGSNGRIYFFSTDSFIILETIPEEESFNPNLLRKELFVR